MIKKLFIISSLSVFTGIFAQKTHTVAKGENPFSIAKKYGMTVDELTKLNSNIKNGQIQIGDVLKVKGKAATEQKPVKPAKTFGKIIIEPKQTIYGITKQYHISEAELRALNPDLDNNMKIGSEVVLPADLIAKYGTAPKETPSASSDADWYEIQPKDNYYQITKKFGMTQSALFALNPGLEAKGLQPGDKIKVKGKPDIKEVKTTEFSSNPPKKYEDPGDDYATYTVLQDDTVFSIVNKFGISIDELTALNPELSKGLKAGMVLKVKKLEAAYVKKNGDELNVVLMLPFGFKSNESRYRSMATDFMTGAKLAIERNAQKGMKLDVKIVDSGSEAEFKNSVTQINQDNTDLIIGPFFKSNIVDMLGYVGSKKIPVVAPFANSEDLYGYSNLIIIETNDQVYADRIISEVKQAYSDQKIYIVADKEKSNAGYIKSGLEKQLKKPNIIIVNSASEIQTEKNMMTGQPTPVIAILANNSDDAAKDFTDKMITISQETQGNKAFSMYYSPIFDKKENDLTQVSLVYLMDRKINEEGSFEKEILAQYKAKYCKLPPKYAVIGFDVVNDMLSRENKKGEIFKQMGAVQTQLATKFEFNRIKSNGAYVNSGYRVIRLMMP